MNVLDVHRVVVGAFLRVLGAFRNVVGAFQNVLDVDGRAVCLKAPEHEVLPQYLHDHQMAVVVVEYPHDPLGLLRLPLHQHRVTD